MKSSPVSTAVSFRVVRRSLLVLTLAAVGCVALLMPGAALARHSHRHTEARPHNKLADPYAAALLMEPVTDTVIFQKNAHEQWPTASLAKMMIMLIVAQKLHNGSLKLTDQITTSRKAAEMGGSQVYLKQGEKFSLNAMMEAIVVHSANDASVAVAQYIGGSTENFVDMMNREAARLGMKDTHYYSVHGLPPGPGQHADVSSAWDEAILARALVRYPQVLKWSSINTAPFRHGTFQLYNTNHLVRTFPGCDGLKTGFYYKAGFNVVATAHRDGMRLIAVVLGSPRKAENFKSAAALMAQGFADYQMRTVGIRGTPAEQMVAVSNGTVPSFKPLWGENLRVLAKRGSHDPVTIQFKLPKALAAPIRAGQPVGVGEAVSGDKVTGTAPLLAPAAIAVRPSILQRLRHVF